MEDARIDAKKTEVTIGFCGDIMLGAEVTELMGNASIKDWVAGVSGAWKSADLLIANLESPCVTRAKPIDGPLPELIFHAPASRLAELPDAGFSAVTLANNHILNCGPLGLLETIRGLDEAGIHHTGAGMNLTEALQPAFIPVRDLTVGLVAFCYGPPASRFSPGVAPCDPKWMRKSLAAARTGADLVIAALHDGLEYSDVPPSKTQARLRFLAENGADIVVGHHPHVLQGLEWYGEVPIAASLGDFLNHCSLPEVTKRILLRIAMGRFASEEVMRDTEKFGRGAILTISISGSKKSIQWHPFRQDNNLRPQLSSGNVQAEDLKRLSDLSNALSDPDDPRLALADRVVETVKREGLDNLGIQKLLQLALRPKWRYIPSGMKSLWRRIRTITQDVN